MNEIINPALTKGLRDLTSEKFLSNFISALVGLLLIAGAIVALFLLLIGGIQWMTAGSDKAATEAARGRITAALAGLLILFATWALINLLEQFLGIIILGGPIVLPKI